MMNNIINSTNIQGSIVSSEDFLEGSLINEDFLNGEVSSVINANIAFTGVHADLAGRNDPNQHTIQSITGLEEALNNISSIDLLEFTNEEILILWNSAWNNLY